ncbi:hypothetical protein [Mucilaginibacter flavus]|uniref:hypothetical protein n=1 Tax=Mucilaginibacter flavus TaxID=931504 RepID=UPI0025B29EC0|nr:hypothetical protein [Mucilaginibacter flavus]MDN3582147.1 hypothetical protein [Mucilaginibacter flavus]
MRYFILLFVALVLCSVSSCNKNGLPGPSSTQITGSWRWVKSVGGIGGFTLTPKTEGFNQTLAFASDSTFKLYKNDAVQLSGKFSITRNYKYTPTQNLDLIKINNQTAMAFIIRNDTLYQNDIFIADGFSTVYVRVKPD